jgi:hypothetical protein
VGGEAGIAIKTVDAIMSRIADADERIDDWLLVIGYWLISPQFSQDNFIKIYKSLICKILHLFLILSANNTQSDTALNALIFSPRSETIPPTAVGEMQLS